MFCKQEGSKFRKLFEDRKVDSIKDIVVKWNKKTGTDEYGCEWIIRVFS